MKEIVVLSGKGGTGKTSLVACLAALADRKVLADCDVDAADLHLVLAPRMLQREEFRGGKQAYILPDRCAACGECAVYCRFDAVRFDGPATQVVGKTYRVDPIACEGCGVCVHVCPAQAVELAPAVSGEWYVSETRHGPLVHARLGPAGENSGKLVTIVRNGARDIAEARSLDLVIVDGAPGIGCPVIASMAGASMVLGVAEATLSGKHDIERLAGLAVHFGIPMLVCINKADLNAEVTAAMNGWCRMRGISVVGSIPYDRRFSEAQAQGKSLLELGDGVTARAVRALWRETRTALESRR
ncbi:MAG: ATP-binding protein [candidate division NC10 bacterium]|nr:ATP-binding protein [candidate division NC10 bacterium]